MIGCETHSTKLRVLKAATDKNVEWDLSSIFDIAWLANSKPPSLGTYSRQIATVDLFAGCGGLSLGIAEAAHSLGLSHSIKLACDIDEAALAVYSNNLSPGAALTDPIERLIDRPFGKRLSSSEKSLLGAVGEIDFLVGGPPCQGHSDLNNHTRRNDPRNDLYGVMSRAGQIFQPRCILIENVPGVQHAKNQVVQRTVRELESIGYQFVSIVLNAADFGVAQNRKRHFTIGTTGAPDRITRLINSLKRSPRPVWWAIGDLSDEDADPVDVFRSAAVHSKENFRRINYLFDNSLHELPNEERPDCHKYKDHSYKSVYGRMYPDRPSPTITSGFGSTGQGRFVHPYRKRTLTPHEAARVQFFPDWFSFSDAGRRQLQKLIGNAVPPKLGYVLALSLLESLT
ncbi:MAG: DNA cytosine methyltransferase [Verrucomicrobia bacterium]|nr:DNA cytosine methyltransferase [Verrucomicrobiota bacterium]